MHTLREEPETSQRPGRGVAEECAPQRRPLTAYLALATAMAIVGSSVVAGKLVVASFPVFFAGGVRSAIGAAILLPALLRSERVLPPLRGRDWLVVTVQAFAGVFLFNVFLLYGLKLTTAIDGGLIMSTLPAVITIISFLFLKERLTWKKSLSISLAVFGIMILNLTGKLSGAFRGPNTLLGNLLISGAVLGEAFFIVLGKVASRSMSPLALATLMNVLALLMFLPLSVHEAIRLDFNLVTAEKYIPLLYAGVMVTVVAFILWNYGVSRVSASTAASFTGVLPVSNVVLSYVILGESLVWPHLAGATCIFLGIALNVSDSSSEPTR